MLDVSTHYVGTSGQMECRVARGGIISKAICLTAFFITWI